MSFDYDKYQQLYDDLTNNQEPKKKQSSKCECNVETIFDEYENYIVCPICGLIQKEILMADYYNLIRVDKSYKRYTHIRETISNLQGNIPFTVSENLKNNIIKLSGNKPENIKLALKKLKLSKYYEKIPYIRWYIWKVETPTIKPELYNKIIQLYQKIEREYFKLKLNRKRFLLINFILHKILLNLNCPILASYIEKKDGKNTEIWEIIKKNLKLKY